MVSHIVMPCKLVDFQIVFLGESFLAFNALKGNALVDGLFVIMQPTWTTKISSTNITMKASFDIFPLIAE